MAGNLTLSGGPQHDRQTYKTNSGPTGVSGFEPAFGAQIASTAFVLEAIYISISTALAGTIFIHFYDVKIADGQLGSAAQLNAALPPNSANAATYDHSSGPITVPGDVFIWMPGSAEEVEYQDAVTRRNVRDCDPSRLHVVPINGMPFDNGLIVVASTANTLFNAAAANLLRIKARLRMSADFGLLPLGRSPGVM